MDDENRVFRPGAVVYEGSQISYAGSPDGYQGPLEQEIVVPDGILLPGLLNGHNHAAMSLMRGMADDSPFFEWLTQHVWPVENRLTAEDIRVGSLLAAAEMIRSGTVGFADMYFEVEATAEAIATAGMRAWISRGLVGLEDPEGEKLNQAVAFARDWQGKAEGRIVTMLGPHAPYTCPPEYLERVAEAAKLAGVGIHIHLSESADEMKQLQERYQRTPVQLASEAGIFASRTLIAHGVFIGEEDLPYLQGMTGGVITCPVSNAKLGNGILPYAMLKEAHIPVGLGTDGATSTNSLDMFLEMKAMAWLQKIAEGRPEGFHAAEALWAATRGTAEVLGHPGGRIAEGAPADFIVVDGNQAHMTPEWDVVANLVYSAVGSDVRYVVINGRIVLQEGIITTFDEAEVIREAKARGERLMREGAKH
ncbi:amidohydrolase [Sulfobacillus sp. DSM 109850]|uniref:5-methylthioadenosine/S-adenosylhomocysteine deaminase n=2 Tax=Sulfobacillus harzensis TaxID=2729629 RepID=A0A7Y0L2V4_9FIRM|nr:amidohydrolase [Sulfobacillus harzensis]NMP22281.1 amidohydrolase [Sulfobacillus harzensis]